MSVSSQGHPEIRLIPLTAAYLDIAASIHAAAFGTEAWNRRALAELLAMPGAQGRLALDEADNPVGLSLSLFVVDTAELLTLAVIPDNRCCGIGGQLVREFLECANRSLATNAFLEVAEDNLPAISLYNRLGFRFESRRPDYYRREGNIRVAASVLRHPLTQI